jgi:aquaporin Z
MKEGQMKKYLAELVGTFFLVFFGVGTAVVAGDKVGIVGIAFAFGLGLIAAAYAIGPISGCHINPAVSVGAWFAGRLKTVDLFGYWVGQFAGATLAALVVYFIAGGVNGGYNIANSGLGQNGFGVGYQGGYSLTAAIAYEFVATMLFVIVILGSTQKSAPTGFAGLVIGLTLVVVHLLGIHITGTSVNPARSFGPAIFVGGQAIQQLWVFLLIPTLGGATAGVLFRARILAADPEPISANTGAIAETVRQATGTLANSPDLVVESSTAE